MPLTNAPWRCSVRIMGFYSERIFPRLMEWSASDARLNTLRARALAPASGRVLEIGFGTGINLEHYPTAVASIAAIDPNPGMARLARERATRLGRQVDHRQGSAEKLPFDAASFDCVLSTLTLCSIPDVRSALAEVHRVLRPGGAFLFLEHGRHPSPNIRRWQDRIDPWWGKLFDGCHINRDIAQLVSDAGLQTASITHPLLPKAPSIASYCYLGRAQREQ